MKRKPRLPFHPLTIRVGMLAEASQPYPRPVRRPEDIFDLLRDEAVQWDRERFVTVALDGAHRILGIEEVSVGSLSSAPVSFREVFKALILANAAAFIGVHNHPTGDPKPSPQDFAVTKKLNDAGELLGIPLLDHIILGRERFTSIRDVASTGLTWR